MPKKNPTANQALKFLYGQIQAGCRVVDPACTLDDANFRLYRNRYLMSFKERLKQKGSWDRDKEALIKAAKHHGVIAASVAQFSVDKTQVVSLQSFVKAGHVIEVECEAYVRSLAARAGKKPGPLGGPWCW